MEERHVPPALDQSDAPGSPPPDDAGAAEREIEREAERHQGISGERRGSEPAPSDRPENAPPHPQDVNELGS